MREKKKLFIQIPDEVIRNKNFKMDNTTFITYVYLRFLHFRNYKTDELEINHNEFKRILYISDNRTLKKCFTLLHKHQIVLELVNRFPSNGLLKFTFNDVKDYKTFTQLPSTILHKINTIGVNGVRLLFYYESYINRSESVNDQFAFPSMQTTAAHLGMNTETIIKYNEILVKNKLLKVDKHELVMDGYDDLDKPLYTKYNNHYFVRLNNI